MNITHLASSEDAHYTITTSGKHIFFMHNYSGALTVDVHIPDTEVFIFGIYVGKGADSFKVKTVQRHSVGKNISDLFIKGVFYDNAKFQYEGLICIDKGAQQSNAYQKNQNLILSTSAYVDSRPFLEIEANDVRCTHGSTTGAVDKEHLLYLNARGLSPDDAQKLIVEGFIDDVFHRMQALGCTDVESIRQQVMGQA